LAGLREGTQRADQPTEQCRIRAVGRERQSDSACGFLDPHRDLQQPQPDCGAPVHRRALDRSLIPALVQTATTTARAWIALPEPAARGREPPRPEAVIRPAGAPMLEHNGEWTVSRRTMGLESLAPVSDDPLVRLPGVVA
jgi:hypothetical protein